MDLSAALLRSDVHLQPEHPPIPSHPLPSPLSILPSLPPGTVILSYFSAFLSTPLLMLVPMITVRGAGRPGGAKGRAVGGEWSRVLWRHTNSLPTMHPPSLQVWLGSFPIVINFWAAVSITVYYAATLCLM